MKNRKYEYPWQGMLIASFLGLMGFIILFETKIYKITNFIELKEYIYKYNILLIFGLLFLIVGIYVWVSFILNVIIKPKKEVMFLLKIEDNIGKFINKKGKIYYFKDNNYSVNRYYDVLRTHDNIIKIIDIANENFYVPKEKRSYWLNLYSPVGNFENMLLLPIVYVALCPGLFIFLFETTIFRFFGLIFALLPLSIIIYDLIYKIKLNKNEKLNIENLEDSYFKFKDMLQLVIVLIITFVFVQVFFSFKELEGKLIFIPFLLVMLCNVGISYAKLKHNEKVIKSLNKMPIFILILFFIISILLNFL